MKTNMIYAPAALLILLCGPAALAQKVDLFPRPRCQYSAKYPAQPEAALADFVIERLQEASNVDPLLLSEAKKLKEPDGQEQLRMFLKKNVEIGPEDEQAYRFCEVLRDFEDQLGEGDQPKLNQMLRQQITESQPKTKRTCLPFLCIFHICKC